MKVLFVLAPINYKDEEFEIPNEILKNAGIQTVITNSTGESSKSVDGKTINIDLKLNNASSDEYDGIVFIGGSGAEIYFNNQNALQLVKEFYEKGKIVATICIAPTILANAGILAGKTITGYITQKDKLSSIGNYTGNDIETDGNIITDKWPSAAKEFGNTIVKALIN